MITGKDLIDAGFKPGSYFKEAIEAANNCEGDWREVVKQFVPVTLDLNEPVKLRPNILVESQEEKENIRAVVRSIDTLTRTPVVFDAAIMPDCCPAGPEGTIPVGGVVASTAIHPGMHSSDVCCSVMLSEVTAYFKAKTVLDVAQRVTHFGSGGRSDSFTLPSELEEKFRSNRFLNDKKILEMATTHLGTQGDGNHFLFVGTRKSNGMTCVVTHHGSRGVGAALYKRGMAAAERYTKKISPNTLKQNSWLSPEDEGDYWDALQIVREWTKLNHEVIHNAICDEPYDRFWNEHNFIFKRNSCYYHAKGATPGFDGYADDATGLTLVPLNMAQPVLITKGLDAENGLGFLPHGAGRNFSRTKHKKSLGNYNAEEQVKLETEGLDIRFYSGKPDVSELPSAYKDAEAVKRQIEEFGLAEVVDEVEPYGCIMAGEFDWRKS